MNRNDLGAQQALALARQALRQGNQGEARHWAQIAVEQAPLLEDSWLLLAAVSSPEASVNYLKQALKLNPSSQRARQGMHWAVQRLREKEQPFLPEPNPSADLSQTQPVKLKSTSVRDRRIFVSATMLAVILFATALAAWSSYPQLRRNLASIPQIESLLAGGIPQILAENAGTLVVAPEDLATATGSAPITTASATPMQPEDPTPTYTNTPLPTDTPTPSPTPTYTPLPTSTPTHQPPTRAPQDPPAKPPSSVRTGDRWIDVDLSEQRVYAYEGDQLQRSFLVSTGTWRTPTVQGKYRIYVKYRSQTMSGPGYYLPGVPYVMYFYKGYGLHGTYWHNNFGTPMSHGCINMVSDEAAWLYKWASVGTLVNVHR